MTATKPTLPPEVAELATVIRLVGSCVYFLEEGAGLDCFYSFRFGSC